MHGAHFKKEVNNANESSFAVGFNRTSVNGLFLCHKAVSQGYVCYHNTAIAMTFVHDLFLVSDVSGSFVFFVMQPEV